MRDADQLSRILRLRVSDDSMLASLDVHPAPEDEDAVSVDEVLVWLEDHGIRAPVNSDAVTEAIFEAQTSRRVQTGVVVSGGTPPRNGIPAHLELDVTCSDPDGIIRIVREGQQLAHQVEEQEAVPGSDVHGQELPPHIQSPPQYQGGAGTRMNAAFLTAGWAGMVRLDGLRVVVDEQLELTPARSIANPVVRFPGSVVVAEGVRDGLRIQAGGSVSASGTLDVRELLCRGRLEASGLIGHDGSPVRAGESVQLKFVEHCSLECLGPIQIADSMYQAEARSLQSITFGKSAKVTGGAIIARDLIDANAIGNEVGIPVQVRVGVDFAVERRILALTNRQRQLGMGMQRLRREMQEQVTQDLLEAFHAAEAEQQQLAAQIAELLPQRFPKRDAVIRVRDRLWPGVVLEIAGVQQEITEVTGKLEAKLDPQTDRMVFES